jgi:hypothetical protein
VRPHTLERTRAVRPESVTQIAGGCRTSRAAAPPLLEQTSVTQLEIGPTDTAEEPGIRTLGSPIVPSIARSRHQNWNRKREESHLPTRPRGRR